MMAVPDITPVTIPVLPTEAVPEALLLHVPPPVRSVSVVVRPMHTVSGPVIPDGPGLTVTTAEAIQPVASA